MYEGMGTVSRHMKVASLFGCIDHHAVPRNTAFLSRYYAFPYTTQLKWLMLPDHYRGILSYLRPFRCCAHEEEPFIAITKPIPQTLDGHCSIFTEWRKNYLCSCSPSYILRVASKAASLLSHIVSFF